MGIASTLKEISFKEVVSEVTPDNDIDTVVQEHCEEKLNDLIEREVGRDALVLIIKYAGLSNGYTFLTSTNTRFNIDKLKKGKFNHIVNLKRINDVRWVNKFFESVSSKIEIGGYYINSVETYSTRKKRILRKSIKPFNWFHYTADVFFTRLFPKLPFTKRIYFAITKGKGRVLSRAETFGRLYSCGFEIVDEKLIGDELFFVARKIKEPVFDNNPTYGPIIRLKRHGENGKLFNVYKLRTMHAYSEYLQEYVFTHNSLQEGGKFSNDFRITTEGRFFRKFWIDELPMFINIFKGNLKIVGVRPLSSHYFSLYSDELKNKRIKYKPGLIPPFYVDMPKTLDEIMSSEMRYLEAYDKHPFWTDVRYFSKAFCNIVFKRARSG